MISKVYKSALVDCWSCGKRIPVYTWEGKVLFDIKLPDEKNKPDTLQFRWSYAAKRSYWVNICVYCGMIQGDHYLYDDPETLVEDWIDEDGGTSPNRSRFKTLGKMLDTLFPDTKD